MPDEVWFEVEDPLDDVQEEFVTVLCARAARWDVPPSASALALPDYVSYGYPLAPGESAYGKALVYLDVPGPHAALMTVGGYLDRDEIRADQLHNQLLTLPATSTALAMHATGTPSELAHRAADWFEMVLRIPVLHYQWMRDGEVHVEKMVMARPGARRADLDELVATLGLGPADRVVHLRGDQV